MKPAVRRAPAPNGALASSGGGRSLRVRSHSCRSSWRAGAQREGERRAHRHGRARSAPAQRFQAALASRSSTKEPLPQPLARQLQQLRTGGFPDDAINVARQLPGAKRDLELPRGLRRGARLVARPVEGDLAQARVEGVALRRRPFQSDSSRVYFAPRAEIVREVGFAPKLPGSEGVTSAGGASSSGGQLIGDAVCCPRQLDAAEGSDALSARFEAAAQDFEQVPSAAATLVAPVATGLRKASEAMDARDFTAGIELAITALSDSRLTERLGPSQTFSEFATAMRAVGRAAAVGDVGSSFGSTWSHCGTVARE